MNKKLRVLLFKECNRNCEYCVNKQFDLDSLEKVHDFTGYEEVLITGGEPLLRPKLCMTVARRAKALGVKKVYIYTAMITRPEVFTYLTRYVDGFCITLHNKVDALQFCKLLSNKDVLKLFNTLSMKLVVFKGIPIPRYAMNRIQDWIVKDNVEPLADCPLPEGEDFKICNTRFFNGNM